MYETVDDPMNEFWIDYRSVFELSRPHQALPVLALECSEAGRLTRRLDCVRARIESCISSAIGSIRSYAVAM